MTIVMNGDDKEDGDDDDDEEEEEDDDDDDDEDENEERATPCSPLMFSEASFSRSRRRPGMNSCRPRR